ncbi:MAG: 3-deoxy-7-phosphoheptulonate synthase [Verrucomicrobia bacterium]|nr:3-deoxy-7-phosphoheptulonate synthase [Verrucomicrobiota bacterium]
MSTVSPVPIAPKLTNLRVREVRPLISPAQLRREIPLGPVSEGTVRQAREEVEGVMEGRDSRPLVILGPCSIHDRKAALEYAGRIHRMREELGDRLLLVMRVYFEKPRTTVGWKGLINDPGLDGTLDLEGGLKAGRRLLSEINEMGVPAGTEFLDPVVPQYLADLVSWAAIGARTTESQTHREMASGLSMPVGFKNGTDGSLQVAVDAMLSARAPHAFVGIDGEGATSVIRTVGNSSTHLVLRGGRDKTNYDPSSLGAARESLKKHGLPERLMVDCSHANSGKEATKQETAWKSVVEQKRSGAPGILGLMLESHLLEGRQDIPAEGPKGLKYGVSITDACMGWEQTEALLRWAAQ